MLEDLNDHLYSRQACERVEWLYRHDALLRPETLRQLKIQSDRLRSLEDQRDSARALLLQELGISTAEPLPWPIPLEKSADSISDDASVLEDVRQHNPELLALRAQGEAARSAADLARYHPLPDPVVGIENVRIGRSRFTDFKDDGRDAWIASISFQAAALSASFLAPAQDSNSVISLIACGRSGGSPAEPLV